MLLKSFLLALSCALCIAVSQPEAKLPRDVQSMLLSVGRSARYGPYLLDYSPRRGRVDEGSSREPNPFALEDYLLPKSVQPLSYDVQLIPYLETPANRAFTFDGEERIRVRAKEVTSSIVLHAWDITISQIGVIRVRDGATISVLDSTILTDDRQFFTINLGQALEPGQEYELSIFFSGILTNDGYGFLKSAYNDENGNQKYLTASQFEHNGARRAFPCFDEPNLKATFTFHLACQPGFSALANMPLASKGDPVAGLPGWEWHHFQPSPPMSTFYLAFSTNEFLSVGDDFYKIWSRPEIYQTGEYASQISPVIVSYMEQYTGHRYSLPKMDQIGMIEFFSGAMENWGLLMYQEQFLTYDPTNDDILVKQQVAQIVAHEIAHQWFGDLVSPDWWSHLWLSEGFATYFEHHATQSVGADWQLPEQYVLDHVQYSMISDARASHPMIKEVDSPNSVGSIFDVITYSKGGSIVRFMVNFLGENNFKQGIKQYLQNREFASAVQNDLFQALSNFAPSGMPVTFQQMMDTWTLQAGFPLISVNRDYALKTATVTQQRFGYNGPEKWVVPLTMTRGDAPNFTSQVPRAWILPQDASVNLPADVVPGPNDWILLNIKQTGYYRVNYDSENWRLLTEALKNDATQIDEINRMQLMDDAMTFASAGLLEYDIALGTTAYLAQETRYAPWLVATYSLEYIRDRMYQTPEGVQLFQEYMQERVSPVYGLVSGFNQTGTDGHGTLVTRRLITRWACDTQLDTCNTEGAALFGTWQQTADPDNNNPIALELRQPSYCAGQRLGGQSARDFLLERYLSTSDSAEENRLLAGMGCTSDLTLLQDYLDLSLTGTTIKSRDDLTVLAAVFAHPEGVELALDFIIQNWRTLDPLYTNIGRGFLSISDKLNTQTHYNKINQFLVDNDAELSALAKVFINSALDTVSSTLEWNEANLVTVTEYFALN